MGVFAYLAQEMRKPALTRWRSARAGYGLSAHFSTYPYSSLAIHNVMGVWGMAMSLPRLHRSGDRTYVMIGRDVGQLRQHFAALGLRHYEPKPGDLYTRRWTYDGPLGRSVVTLFPSFAITILGPRIPQIDELVECASVELVTAGTGASDD